MINISTEEFIGTTPAAFVQSPVDSTAIPTFSAKVNIEEVIMLAMNLLVTLL